MPTRRFSAEPDAPQAPVLDDFYRDVALADLQPLWRQEGLMPGAPPLATVPHLWRFKHLRSLAERSGELIPLDRGGDRRVLALCNPGLGGAPWATSTLWGAVQYLGPAEVAPAHRHTPGAVRFVLEGEGVWTLVDGDAVAMGPGDLVLTPSWTWHEHHNPGSTPMIWFDGLDIPMVRALDAVFYEDGPDEMANRAVDPRSRSERRYASGAGLLPDGTEPRPRSPLLAYRWGDTDRALSDLLELEGGRHVSLRFIDPTSGGDAMPTLRLQMHRLFPSGPTPTTRVVGSSVFVAFRGAGTSTVGGQPFTWSAGDMFVVPSWTSVEHEASEPSDLFSISDAPVIEMLGLRREQTSG